MTPKSHLTQIAASLHLDACGACAASFGSTLKEQLQKAGSVPFAPSSLAERLDPSALLKEARSFFVILFPYRPLKPEEGNIALYARPMDYHKVIHRYLQKIIETARPSYPGEQFLPRGYLSHGRPLARLRRRAWVLWKKSLPDPSDIRLLRYHRIHPDHTAACA